MLSAVIIGLIFLLVVGMAAAMHFNTKAEKRKRVLNVIGGGASFKKGKKGSDQNRRRADLARKLKEGGSEDSAEKRNKLADSIEQAGYRFSTRKFWTGSLLLSVVATLVAYVAGLSVFLVTMVAIIFFFGVPRLFLRMSAKSRQKKFMADFADALESMTRLLKAGMPVSEAIKMVAREFSGPLGEEMDRVFDQQKIGVPLAEVVAMFDADGNMQLDATEVLQACQALDAVLGQGAHQMVAGGQGAGGQGAGGPQQQFGRQEGFGQGHGERRGPPGGGFGGLQGQGPPMQGRPMPGQGGAGLRGGGGPGGAGGRPGR